MSNYYMYVSQLEGKVTEEKEEFIASETEKAYSNFSEDGSCKRSALNILSAHTEYPKENSGRINNMPNVWGTRSITAPALSTERLSRFIGMLLISAGVFFISTRTKSYSASVICSIAVFVIPLIWSAFGFTFPDFFLLNPFLIGAE